MQLGVGLSPASFLFSPPILPGNGPRLLPTSLSPAIYAPSLSIDLIPLPCLSYFATSYLPPSLLSRRCLAGFSGDKKVEGGKRKVFLFRRGNIFSSILFPSSLLLLLWSRAASIPKEEGKNEERERKKSDLRPLTRIFFAAHFLTFFLFFFAEIFFTARSVVRQSLSCSHLFDLLPRFSPTFYPRRKNEVKYRPAPPPSSILLLPLFLLFVHLFKNPPSVRLF